MKETAEVTVTVVIGIAVLAGALEFWFRSQGL